MTVDVAAEVAASLEIAPGGDCTTDQVKAWLFDSRTGVAVRLSRIVQDKATRDLLREAAGRSWRWCTPTDSEPQRLWRDLGASFARIALEDDRASVPVGPFPIKGPLCLRCLPPDFSDGSRTVRALAGECRDFCAAPLLTPSDLVCPFPEVSLPYYRPARQWQDNPQAVRVYCNVQHVAVGDFVPASAVLRLRLMVQLRAILRSAWTLCADIDQEYQEFDGRVNVVHGQLWATPDAEERDGAMALLQVYLAGGKLRVLGLTGYEADWSILPADVPTLLDIDLDRPLESHARIEALGLPLTFGERSGRLEYVVQRAVRARPGEVASIVKGGLEWLAAAPGTVARAVAKADTMEQPWADDAPEYLSLTEACKLTDGRLSVSALSKLCKPDGKIRHMRKYGKTGRSTRCKVHVADFRRYMQGRQSDTTFATALAAYFSAAGKGDIRFFWRCSQCGADYPENSSATVNCLKCGTELKLIRKAPPKPRR